MARSSTVQTPAIKSESATLYTSLRPMDYAGSKLDRGQVFTLIGARNDEKLVRLRYIREIGHHDQLYTCSTCGAQFVHLGGRDEHGKNSHRARELTPGEEDERSDKLDVRLTKEAPLALENSAASRSN